jgi:hypothetical protein
MIRIFFYFLVAGLVGFCTPKAQSQSVNINSIYINQVGSGDTYNITQAGPGNLLDGASGNTLNSSTHTAAISGGSNQVTVRQGDSISNSGKNTIDLSVVGPGNILNLNQGTDPNGLSTGLDTGGHYQYVYVNGTDNMVTTSQQNTTINAGQSATVSISGDLNTVGITQTGTARQQLFASVSGNSNTVSATQTGSAGHYLNVSESGNGNSAVVNQSGSTSNYASITLVNAGAPASVNLTQTGGQNYNITQTCVTTCSAVTVRQGN